MHARDRLGRQRYGVPLQANNGRDALQDAYEEALDLAVYLRTAIEERPILLTAAPQIGPKMSPAGPNLRTKALVIHERKNNHAGSGCCERYGDMKGCDCYETAWDYCPVCNNQFCDNCGGKH